MTALLDVKYFILASAPVIRSAEKVVLEDRVLFDIRSSTWSYKSTGKTDDSKRHTTSIATSPGTDGK
jgi:hypothetical protein